MLNHYMYLIFDSTAKSTVTPHFQRTVCDWTSFLCSSVLGKTATGFGFAALFFTL